MSRQCVTSINNPLKRFVMGHKHQLWLQAAVSCPTVMIDSELTTDTRMSHCYYKQ